MSEHENPASFESELRRASLRKPPAAWREEILRAATEAQASPQRWAGPGAAVPPPWRWRDVFWPCPQAWLGLAAVWVIIVFLRVAGGENPSEPSPVAAVPSPEMLAVLREERRALEEFINPAPATAAAPPKEPAPKPRGQLQSGVRCA